MKMTKKFYKKLNKNQLALAISLLGGVGMVGTAHATNWLQLQGTEPAGVAAPVKVWGFLQPTYFYIKGNRSVSGATAASGLNGQVPNFNLVPPDFTSSSSFNLFRARVGVRGTVMPFDNSINYFVLAELGDNAYTNTGSAGTHSSATRMSDASITFNYIPGARVRVGLFKTPGPLEGLTGIQTLDYVQFTNVTQQLIQEPFFDTGAATVAAPLPGSTTTGYSASPSGGTIDAFRDTGVQVFDWFRSGPWETSYAAMVGNGSPNFTTDNNNGKDFYGMVQESYVLGNSAGPRRRDVSSWLWYQHGNRTFNSQGYKRVRQGLGAQMRTGFMQPWAMRVTGEYMQGYGMIPVAQTFPSASATMYPGFNNRADGYYAESGLFVSKNIELDLRYDQYNRLTNSAADERSFKTWAMGVQYFFTPMARVTLNYEIRSVDVSHPGAITAAAALQNAQAVTNSIGDRIDLQTTVQF